MNKNLQHTGAKRLEVIAGTCLYLSECKVILTTAFPARRAFTSSVLANVAVCSALTLTLSSMSVAAADSAQLEEVLVSGVVDPRMGSLLTSTEIRTTSVEEQVTLPPPPDHW